MILVIFIAPFCWNDVDSLGEGENKQPKGKKRKNQIESETCSQRKRRKQVADNRNRSDKTLTQSGCQLNEDNPGRVKCNNNNDNNMAAVEHGNDSGNYSFVMLSSHIQQYI